MHSSRFETHSSRFEQVAKYFAGVVMNQAPEAASICAIRRTKHFEWTGNPRSPQRHLRKTTLEVGYLERLPPGLMYPEIAARVADLMKRPIWSGNIEIAVDKTRVGEPVVGIFDAAGLDVTAVAIGAGDSEVYEDHYNHRVPRSQIIARLQAALHGQQLVVQKNLPDTDALVRELQNLKLSFTDAGRMRLDGHDGDLVTALGLAVWHATAHDYESSSEPLRI